MIKTLFTGALLLSSILRTDLPTSPEEALQRILEEKREELRKPGQHILTLEYEYNGKQMETTITLIIVDDTTGISNGRTLIFASKDIVLNTEEASMITDYQLIKRTQIQAFFEDQTPIAITGVDRLNFSSDPGDYSIRFYTEFGQFHDVNVKVVTTNYEQLFSENRIVSRDFPKSKPTVPIKTFTSTNVLLSTVVLLAFILPILLLSFFKGYIVRKIVKDIKEILAL